MGLAVAQGHCNTPSHYYIWRKEAMQAAMGQSMMYERALASNCGASLLPCLHIKAGL
jgi:hypothetical protein